LKIKNNYLRCFCEDLDATKTARFLGMNGKTINYYFSLFREKIIHYLIEQTKFSGEVEVDESYFSESSECGVNRNVEQLVRLLYLEF